MQFCLSDLPHAPSLARASKGSQTPRSSSLATQRDRSLSQPHQHPGEDKKALEEALPPKNWKPHLPHPSKGAGLD